MSKKEKLINRLKSKPRDFTFAELETLLSSLGLELSNKGRSSGSRVEFTCENIEIEIHKPHRNKPIPIYQIIKVLNELETGGLI